MPIEEERITDFAASRWASVWHALYTRHQYEKIVAQALSGKGFEIFLPNIILSIVGRTVARNSCYRFSLITCSFEAASTEC